MADDSDSSWQPNNTVGVWTPDDRRELRQLRDAERTFIGLDGASLSNSQRLREGYILLADILDILDEIDGADPEMSRRQLVGLLRQQLYEEFDR